MTFLEHCYERRQRFSTLWTADELVWGEIGPKSTTTHNYDPHFDRLYPSYPNALDEATQIIKRHLKCILYRPYNDFEELYDFIEYSTTSFCSDGEPTSVTGSPFRR